MRAAENFIWSDSDDPSDRVRYKAGEDIPDKVAKDLQDSGQEHLILEKVKKSKLTYDQLLILADLQESQEIAESNDEFDEEGFQEAMKEFKTKQDLVDWANENVNIQLEPEDGTRDELEEWIMMAAQGIDPFETDEEEDGDE
jgi:hypothetical protein